LIFLSSVDGALADLGRSDLGVQGRILAAVDQERADRCSFLIMVSRVDLGGR
jgi:hypothetical protein